MSLCGRKLKVEEENEVSFWKTVYEREIEKGLRGKGPEAFDILWAEGFENYIGATQETLIKDGKLR